MCIYPYFALSRQASPRLMGKTRRIGRRKIEPPELENRRDHKTKVTKEKNVNDRRTKGQNETLHKATALSQRYDSTRQVQILDR